MSKNTEVFLTFWKEMLTKQCFFSSGFDSRLGRQRARAHLTPRFLLAKCQNLISCFNILRGGSEEEAMISVLKGLLRTTRHDTSNEKAAKKEAFCYVF